MYLCGFFKKHSKFICAIYILFSVFSYIYFGEHPDGRIALLWIIFIILAIIHFFEEFANKHFKWFNNLYINLSFVILIILLLYFIFTIPFQVYVCKTSSMEPTLYPENLVIVNKIAYRKKKPQRNDIALIRVGFDTIPVIHRIIACPNDTIIIRDGVVQVNGEIIKFNALDTLKPETIVLPKDTYYHKGDNPNSYFDIISSHQILGKAIYISGGKSQPD